MPVLAASDDLRYPPAVAFCVEGDAKTYRLNLTKGQDGEDELNDWDLALKITAKTKQGKKLDFATRHPTFVRGNECVYLHNRSDLRAGPDAKADLHKGKATHPGYVRMLKRHLAILGFYRPEVEAHYKHQKYRKYSSMPLSLFDDTFDDELDSAVQLFHAAAKLEHRPDGTTGAFVEKKPTFDPAQADVAAEIKDGRICDASKRELCRWLGDDYETVDGAKKPKYRNPLCYSPPFFLRTVQEGAGRYCAASCRHATSSGGLKVGQSPISGDI